MMLLQSLAGAILVGMTYHINDTLGRGKTELRYSKRGRAAILTVSVSSIIVLCILSLVVGTGSGHPTYGVPAMFFLTLVAILGWKGRDYVEGR